MWLSDVCTRLSVGLVDKDWRYFSNGAVPFLLVHCEPHAHWTAWETYGRHVIVCFCICCQFKDTHRTSAKTFLIGQILGFSQRHKKESLRVTDFNVSCLFMCENISGADGPLSCSSVLETHSLVQCVVCGPHDPYLHLNCTNLLHMHSNTSNETLSVQNF